MNEMLSTIVLAILQGVAEWLPISSSGHLVLFSSILQYDNSIMFDVALHFGTLLAVFVYFGKDIVDIAEALLKGKWKSRDGKMGLLLVVSCIPAAAVGYLFRDLFESAFDSLLMVAFGFGITGLLLFIASMDFKVKKEMPTWKDSFLIGCAQAVAIFPGISRSGSTVSSALILGLSEKEAVRFSFLMAIPVIFGANVLEMGTRTFPSSYLLPTLISFVVGLITIHITLKIIVNSRKNLRWFGAYALLLAIGIVTYLIVS